MHTAIIPRENTDHTHSLIDFDSPYLSPYLVLKCCLKDEIGDVSREQENSIWTMIEQNNISYQQAQDFAKKKAAERKKRALDDWWQSATFKK